MRTHPVIAVLTAIMVGFGVKLTFFSTPKAAADLGVTARVARSVAQTEILQVERIHDMTFVFADGD